MTLKVVSQNKSLFIQQYITYRMKLFSLRALMPWLPLQIESTILYIYMYMYIYYTILYIYILIIIYIYIYIYTYWIWRIQEKDDLHYDPQIS